MRDLHTLLPDIQRVRHHSGHMGNRLVGAFVWETPGGVLRIIAASGEGWDHVSVSLEDRCPTWAEMEQVKRAFFKDDECAMQLHVPLSDHINCHPNVLHLWRPYGQRIPRPPSWMV